MNSKEFDEKRLEDFETVAEKMLKDQIKLMLGIVLDEHNRWVESGGKVGVRLDLSHSYLREADLSYANLTYARLNGTNFGNSDLRGADFSLADLDNSKHRKI